MSVFFNQENCSIDGNGRFKLSPKLQKLFADCTEGEVVMRVQPEGSVAIFPPAVWADCEKEELAKVKQIADPGHARRMLRALGSSLATDSISNQGRITIPALFRERAGLPPGGPAIVVGCVSHIELWNPERWDAENRLTDEHQLKSTAQSMAQFENTRETPA